MKKNKIIIVSVSVVVLVFSASLLSYLIQLDDGMVDESKSTIDCFGEVIYDVEWNPNGTKIASISHKQYENVNNPGELHIRIWDYPSLKFEREIGTDQDLSEGTTLSWSPDGKRLAYGGMQSTSWHGVVLIFDTSNWECIKTLTGDFTFVMDVDWSWDGTFLAAADFNMGGNPDSSITIWETRNWTNITLSFETAITSLRWHPSNYTFATAHYQDSSVRVFNSKGIPLLVLTGHEGSARAVAWSPNGAYLASGGGNGIILWNTTLWFKENEFMDETYQRTRGIVWNSDSSVFASGGRHSKIILSTPQERIDTLTGHHDDVTKRLSWNHHHNLLASGSDDKTIKIWEI